MKKCDKLLCGITELKLSWKKNKVYFIVALTTFLIGLLLAVKGIKTFCEEKKVLSLAEYISAGEYPYMSVIIWTTIIPSLICLSILLLSVNYYSIFAYYLELIIINKVILRNNIASIAHSVIPGALSFTLFSLPLLVIDTMLLTLFWIGVSEIIAYPCRKEIIYIVPYRCHWERTKPLFVKTLISMLSFNLIYTVLISCVFVLIF